MKNVFFRAIMISVVGIIVSGCYTAPSAGGLAADDWYDSAKLLSNEEMHRIDLIVERSAAVLTNESWSSWVGRYDEFNQNDEYNMDTQYPTLVYRRVRQGLYVPKYRVLMSRHFVMSMTIDDGFRTVSEGEYSRIDMMPPTFMLYTLCPEDVTLLRQILSPWKSEDEEREADGDVRKKNKGQASKNETE